MDAEVRALVDRRWTEYGIGTGDASVDGASRSLRHLLRR
jgi:hypothetical protein